MTYALDTAYKMSKKLIVIKDFLNALQHISDPTQSPCWNYGEQTEPPVVTVETDGECRRVLVDGLPVTDWICPPETNEEPQEPTVGTLGFTVSELESMVMGCLNLTDSLRWNGGVLEYRTCDGWKPVPGMAGAITTSASGNAAAQWGIDEWLDSGTPEIAPSAGVPHDNPAYTTLDSMRCAKATALVNEIWNVLTIGNAVNDANDFSSFVTGVTASLTVSGWIAAGASLATTLGYGLANGIWALVTGQGLESYAQSLIDVLEDETSKNALICDLVERMEPPVQFGLLRLNTLTVSDIQTALDRFEAIVPHDDVVRETLGLFPIKSWQDVVTSKVASTDCGCENYLPYGYIPPAGNDFILRNKGVASMGTTIDTLTSLHNQPEGYEYTLPVPNVGAISGSLARTVYAGLSASYPIDRFHWIIEASQPFTLASVALTVSIAGNPTAVNFSAHYLESTSEQWKTLGIASDGIAPIDTEYVLTSGGNLDNVKLISIQCRVRAVQSSNTRAPLTVTAIKVNGSYMGTPIVDLPLNVKLLIGE